jgi:16S rRNA (cytidine1402-2'-O)-methyltransferase
VAHDAGELYVVATPIGNLGDLSPRAAEILATVDLIAAEDTRQTGVLLQSRGITTPMLAYHEHNEDTQTPRLLARLLAGQRLALVSDAGTPLVSDPGYRLVSAARERGLRVVPVPGPSALIAALCASGLPSDRFLFLGFPPRTRERRRTLLRAVAGEPGTLIFYEAGQRLEGTLTDLATELGERPAVLARELTKRYETWLTGTPAGLARQLAGEPGQTRGEHVILVAGAPETAAAGTEARRILEILAGELPLKQAAALTARITGTRRNELYRLGLAATGRPDGRTD